VSQAVRGVCFVVPELDRIGGYELATLTLVRGLRAHGIPVRVVTAATTSRGALGNPDAIHIEVTGRRTLLHVFPKLLTVLARDRSTFSIIHCPTFGYLSGLAVLAGRILRRPTLLRVATENDVREFSDARHWKPRLFFRLLRRAAGVIAPSGAIRDELLRAGFSNEKIFLLHNAVDVERFRAATPSERTEAKTRLGLPPGIPIIGTVARLIARKGIDLLLRAFLTVQHTYRARLLVVGDGPQRDELQALGRELGIEHSISWLGLQADASICLRAMDVFALPARLEGSPNAVLEAMAAGLPIVATRIGGISDLLEEGRIGLLVPSDDAEALAGALDKLLSDSHLRTDLGCRARTRAVSVFSLSGAIPRLIDLYSALQTK